MTRTIEQVVGQRIRERREHLGLTQQHLGERVGQYLEKSWTRQAVYAAEKGRRDFRAVELVALSLVLDCSVGYLSDPIMTPVELPSGQTIDPKDWPGWGYKVAAEWRDEARSHFLTGLDQVVSVITDMVLKSGEGLIEIRRMIEQVTEYETGEEE